jgi:hypothetical protein
MRPMSSSRRGESRFVAHRPDDIGPMTSARSHLPPCVHKACLWFVHIRAFAATGCHERFGQELPRVHLQLHARG